MIDPNSLGLICIIKTPQGGAPEEIRKLWVDVEIPCLYFEPANASSRNIATREIVPPHAAYVVLQEHALQALAKKSPEAARYWNHIGYPQSPLAMFTFRAEDCKVLKRVPTEREFYR